MLRFQININYLTTIMSSVLNSDNMNALECLQVILIDLLATFLVPPANLVPAERKFGKKRCSAD